MGLGEIEERADQDDPCRIDFSVRHVVMALDVIKVHGISDARLLIQIQQVTLQIPIVDDATQVAFEMAVINRVETNKRAEKPPVRLDNTVPEQISTLQYTLVEFVERFKKFAAGNLVWPLARGETSSVNAVIHIVVKK